jgi:hypothetical protein
MLRKNAVAYSRLLFFYRERRQRSTGELVGAVPGAIGEAATGASVDPVSSGAAILSPIAVRKALHER